MIRWFSVIFLALMLTLTLTLMLIRCLSPLLQKLGFGELPGDVRLAVSPVWPRRGPFR